MTDRRGCTTAVGVLKNHVRGVGNPFPTLVIHREGIFGGAKGGNHLTAGLSDKPRSCGAPGFFNKPPGVTCAKKGSWFFPVCDAVKNFERFGPEFVQASGVFYDIVCWRCLFLLRYLGVQAVSRLLFRQTGADESLHLIFLRRSDTNQDIELVLNAPARDQGGINDQNRVLAGLPESYDPRAELCEKRWVHYAVKFGAVVG